ncbi:OmpA family protein [Roseovarius aestuariivivens]|uniref:OmpA family protein n=1 Tax=Roseovarius aestuariivivens TaxID=1888910 RepID=UPI0010808BF1|nr:OmpA family protein [Roseovarius aestuariivivens]
MPHRVAIALFIGLWPGIATALNLSLPSSADKTREIREAAASYFVPVGPYDGSEVPALRVEGALVQEAWRMEAPGLTTLQILRPLRRQVIDAGYDILFTCAARDCGGFDFRFQTRVLPAPDMFVDLLDYHFLSARRGESGEPVSFATLLVSRVGGAGYIQVIRVDPGDTARPALEVAPEADTPDEPALQARSLATRLMREGRAVLNDLDFASGTVALGAGPFASLDALAEFLQEKETRRVALVGHTDTVGGLEPNISLSRRRAQAVLERLVSTYGIARDRLEAGGMGYLAPLTTNLTEDGREQNRRVEAVLLSD